MAGLQLPPEAGVWATIIAGGAAGITLLVAGFKAIWRWARGGLTAWKGGDVKLDRRITDLAANHLREIDALRTEFAKHETKDDERFARFDGRLDEIRGEMARRDDLGRVEGKIDQLLTSHFGVNR